MQIYLETKSLFRLTIQCMQDQKEKAEKNKNHVNDKK